MGAREDHLLAVAAEEHRMARLRQGDIDRDLSRVAELQARINQNSERRDAHLAVQRELRFSDDDVEAHLVARRRRAGYCDDRIDGHPIPPTPEAL